MAVTAPPRPTDPPASSPRGLGTGPRPPGIVADHVFKWIALASGLLVLAIAAPDDRGSARQGAAGPVVEFDKIGTSPR